MAVLRIFARAIAATIALSTGNAFVISAPIEYVKFDGRALVEKKARPPRWAEENEGRMLMEAAVLEIQGLTKRYHGRPFLKIPELTIRQGEFCALIGENGAGKSTLIELIVGLRHASSGVISLFGSTAAQSGRARIGYMPDSCSAWLNLSAFENLDVRCDEWGLKEKWRIDEILDLVGLADTGARPVGRFSLGMKRRLDLAVALLGDPELLILDEPVNGLDPAGVVQIRETLKSLNQDRGKTLIVSSHNLAELERTANRFLVMSNGELLASPTMEQIESSHQGNTIVETGDAGACARALSSLDCVSEVEPISTDKIRVRGAIGNVSEIARQLLDFNIRFSAIYNEKQTLESYYRSLVGGEGHERSDCIRTQKIAS